MFFGTLLWKELGGNHMNIADIAKLAGVSSAAVSRYFNNGYISEEKKKAIQKVVEETGYRPSIQAQMLRTKKTKMIGVILPKIDSAAMGSVVAGILSVLSEHGYRLLLADTRNDVQTELDYLSVFAEKQVDGVIFIATVFTKEHKKALKNLKIPVIIVGQRLSGYCCIYHDDYHATYDMTNLFLEKGRRNLGYIGVFDLDEAVGLERRRGFFDAVKEAGLSRLQENCVIATFSIESGYEKMKELWEKDRELDGVICATDDIAIGAMKFLKEQGICIPEQVMLAGHDDSTLSKVTTPTLTTVHFSYENSGILAAKNLIHILTKKDEGIREIKLGYSIVENKSTIK